MRRFVIALAAPALLLAACSSGSSSSTESAAAAAPTKESFCAGAETLLGDAALPEPSPTLSKAEIDKATATIDGAMTSIKGGIELKVITQEQFDSIDHMAALMRLSLTEPGLLDGSVEPTAEQLGMTPEEFATIFTQEGVDQVTAAETAMNDYCKAE